MKSLFLTACAFSRNRAALDGGGASVHYAFQLAVVDTAFSSNAAANGSALHVSTVNIFDALYEPAWLNPLYVAPDILDRFQTMDYSVAGSAFTGNTAAECGGGLWAAENAVVAVAGTLFQGNSGNNGGAVSATGLAQIVLRGCALAGNAAGACGGGIYAAAASIAVAVACNFTNNTAAHGGALATADASSVSLKDVELRGNAASVCGGALALNSSMALNLTGVVAARGNRARAGGAVCALLRNEATQICAAPLAAFPFLVAANPAARVMLVNNTADTGGGALFASCTAPAGATLDLGAAAAAGRRTAGWVLEGNLAAYGATAGAQVERLEFMAAEGPGDGMEIDDIAHAPGDVLRMRLRLEDGFNQTGRPAAGERFELLMKVPQTGDGGTKDVSVFCRPNGVCDAADADVRLPWPAAPAAGGGRIFAPAVQVSLRLRQPAEAPALAPATTNLVRRACGIAAAYDPVSAFCMACGRGQYVTDSDSGRCLDCPVGATCDGAALVGDPITSIWALDTTAAANTTSSGGSKVGALRLAWCPPGYVLVRDSGLPGLDRCVLCPPGKFSPEPAVYPTTVPARASVAAKAAAKAGQLWTTDAASASLLCQTCPG